jgi:predicted ArsR family transcriptional regulator
VLKRCPFKDIATSYQTVICPLHLGLIKGALTELSASLSADRLEPFAEQGACVAHLTP